MAKKQKIDLEQIKQQLSEKRSEIYEQELLGCAYRLKPKIQGKPNSLERSLGLYVECAYQVCSSLHSISHHTTYESIEGILIPKLIAAAFKATALLTVAMSYMSQDDANFENISNPSFRASSITLKMSLANIFTSLSQLRRLLGEEFEEKCYATISSINSLIVNLKIRQ